MNPDIKRRLSDIPSLLRTPMGRVVLTRALNFKVWPLAYHMGRLYRKYMTPGARIIAVTGSFGKTTTTRTIATVLSDCSYSIDWNQTCYLALRLFKLASREQQAVFEVGVNNAPGRMRQQARMLAPQTAVVTSIGSEHNTTFKTLEDTREEKAWLVRNLEPGGVAVVNGDDPHVRWIARQVSGKVITFGYGRDSDIRADQLELDWPHGTRFRLWVAGKPCQAFVALFGCHSLYAALAAVAVAWHQGMSLERILANLTQVSPVPYRMKPQELPCGAWLLADDFKGTPETIHAALDFMEQLPASRKIVVMGNMSEMHDDHNEAQRRLGKRVGRIASIVLFLGTNYKHFRTGVRRAGLDSDKLIYCHRSVKQASEVLKELLRPGDVVLLKGRGDQRFRRIALSLNGHEVGCDHSFCNRRRMDCRDCPELSTG